MPPQTTMSALRSHAHVDPVKPAHAGERAAIFFPFLDVAFAIRGTNERAGNHRPWQASTALSTSDHARLPPEK